MLNHGLVRFRREGQTPEQDDALTDETIKKINANGEAFFSGRHGVAAARCKLAW